MVQQFFDARELFQTQVPYYEHDVVSGQRANDDPRGTLARAFQSCRRRYAIDHSNDLEHARLACLHDHESQRNS
jgi:hypothetical protein